MADKIYRFNLKISVPFPKKPKNLRKYLVEFMREIDSLSNDNREEFMRVFRFYNKGLWSKDVIDKFINFFIAFEILGKSMIKDEDGWISKICKSYNLKSHYDNIPLSQVRAAIVHRKNKKLEWHKALEIIKKHIYEFEQDIHRLIKLYLDNPP